MYQTKTWKEKLSLFLQIFIPLLIYQFANFSASFIDTMMTGHYSTVDLAGVSMATSFWNPFFALLTGIVSALVPIIGQHLGRGNQKRIRQELHHFIYLAIALSLLLFLLVFLGAVPTLRLLQLESAVFQVAKHYLFYISIGILPFLLFSVFRSFFDSLGLTRLSMYLMLLIVPFNSFFNYLLIYGKWGLPRLGGAGTGMGTALAYWVVLGVVIGVMCRHPKMKEYQIWKKSGFDFSLIKEDLRLGLPIGLQIFAEVAIFAVVGLYMSKFSSQVIASHQAAMNFATLLYAFPLSISAALPIVISYEIGAGRNQDVKEYSRLGRLIALGFASMTLSFLYFFRPMVASLYGYHPAFIQLTSQFLTYALFFQLADAFTAPIQGILRGYKDTTVPFIIGLVSYWSLTFPIAFFLDSSTSLGPFAYWIGLVVGIFVCGLSLNLRLRVVVKRVV
ncbi:MULTISPECIES: MATE family efflux transporter [unclassified Streptococcus]|uniref:MATE family efflux transporter n=1 Tax=unclassified Streptococcus TaxID=2608887 RepID=UPI001071600B|nr:MULTISPECIES: MATE family efflux transporter [unclassified Streptococcus]MBF0788107.1 MATE family efflux transporter [Streptococcus sp. 19428wC2_LYSM12]MCQ9212597.1 MATE family efflux transporter [Streptococcus sp. B01]MCQ9213936.1 MATE family efflux transporter [Streptococcus sp. O1]TFV04865.1 MATE family efflux transporter [Streptococcus sp. LYSM12]